MAKVVAKKIVEDLTKKVIKQVGLKASVSVTEEKEAIQVRIVGDELGVLIGYHGETLESLQLLLTLFVNKKLAIEEWRRVNLDIGDWCQERREVLRNMVEKGLKDMEGKKLERITLPSMSAAQRREIHVLVNETYPEVISESEGEEPNRRVVIYRK